MSTEVKTGLALLREPFAPHHISQLPKPTKQQTDEVKADYRKGIRCTICGAWHHPQAVHLSYVGHAALTHRLLDADPAWTWEPAAVDATGHPIMDNIGGMWIRLTVCGVTRLGYGHPDGKEGGNAVKEVIGDALRNAAMRFGAALDLWHKGDLHGADDDDDVNAASNTTARPATPAQDESPKGRAQRITAGVTKGDAPGAAQFLSTLGQKDLDAIWSLLAEDTQAALTAAWPKD